MSRQRVALVCGGAGGIGAAVSRALAGSGFTVAVADLDADAAESTAAALDNGLDNQGLGCDLSDPEAVSRLARALRKTTGLPDVLVNLTGVVRNAALTRVRDEDFDAVYRSHVLATLSTSRVFGLEMRRRGYGRIINTSSVAALGTRGGTAYSAAKAAIEGMTRTASLELAPYGVTVNCVAPGVVNSGMFLRLEPEYQELTNGKIPLGRPAEPDEIGSVYAFLASEGASYVTGQTLTVCGGLSVGALD